MLQPTQQVQANGNGHYTPKASHPWRRYKNRFSPLTPEEEAVKKNLPSIKVFLTQIVENWDTYDVSTGDFEDGLGKLRSMGDDKIAEWLVSFVKRTWVGNGAGKSFLLDL
jgi:hypothetical protein